MLRIASLCLTLTVVLTVAAFGDQPDTGKQYGTIDVTIAPVRIDDGGVLLVSLYDSEKSWLTVAEAVTTKTIPAGTDTVIVVFDSLVQGEYALSVIHDKNENGKFDMRWFPFPKPKEGAGVSNNHRRKGKPRYDKAVFSVGEGTKSLLVEMVY
jgi:uncharacterized protein (DUF2141 family)